ncbi:MAG: threonine synthase, partial [Chloroflexi bacterium]|nr:threonine synthase [Chloroflexota bacterium]
ILTGNGLKDPDTAIAQVKLPEPLPPTMDALADVLNL